jgi:hypothetical protein
VALSMVWRGLHRWNRLSRGVGAHRFVRQAMPSMLVVLNDEKKFNVRPRNSGALAG